MLESEREFLTQALRRSKGSVKLWVEGGTNALITWAVLMLLILLGWKIVTWAAAVIFHFEISWQSSITLWMVSLAALSSAFYAVKDSIRLVKSRRNFRSDIRADLEVGQVIEEFYTFTAAKCFEEPEHGGLFYFLRTTDDKVFVIYDEESQNLGAEGENPLSSKFQPSTELVINRAPKTNWVVSKNFSGVMLEAGEPQVLAISPEAWPESESFCKFRWDQLEELLSKKRKKK